MSLCLSLLSVVPLLLRQSKKKTPVYGIRRKRSKIQTAEFPTTIYTYPKNLNVLHIFQKELTCHKKNMPIFTVILIIYQVLEAPLALRLSSWEMDMANQVLTLDEAVYFSQSANIFRDGMNLTIFLQLWVNNRADWLFKIGNVTDLGKGKLWIQTC